MPFSRLPGKQGVKIIDQPVEVDGPVTNGDPAPATYNPVIVGGEALDFGHGVSAQDIVSLWMTRGGAPVIGAYADGTSGSDNTPAAFVSPTGANALLQYPLGVAGFVYDPTLDNWVKMRGNTSGIYTIPGYTFAAILNLTTAAVGSNWTAFASAGCTALDVSNVTGADIEYRRGGTGNAMRIAQGASRMIVGITNADEIQIRRVDLSNTQVVITAEAFT